MDNQQYEETILALENKLRALAPHGSCACSYDKPDDLCAHHSPQLSAVRKERDALRAALSQVMGAIDNSRLSPKPGCGAGGQTTDAILRASAYHGVDAWAVKCARSALYADYDQEEKPQCL